MASLPFASQRGFQMRVLRTREPQSLVVTPLGMGKSLVSPCVRRDLQAAV